MRPIPIVIALFACLASIASALADSATTPGARAYKSDASFRKLGPKLHGMSVNAKGVAVNRGSIARDQQNRLLRRDTDSVIVDVVAREDVKALQAELKGLGMTEMSTYGRTVSGRLPISALEFVAASGVVGLARPAAAMTHVGLVTSQGDRSMRTDEVRASLGIDGSGTRVGALSDSFGCTTGPLAAGNPWTSVDEDKANDDLPADVVVLSDLSDPATSGCIDEGRAMLQLVHDAAPGASAAFHTAFNGQADFAQGILELASQAGSDVIVDDVIYFAEPMFADGIIGQAADIVKSWGIPYFSSAGNNERASYESAFRLSSDTGISGLRHDFDAGGGVDTLQSITVAPGEFTIISFQWDQPYFSVSGGAGSASDVDMLFYADDGSLIADCATTAELVCQFAGNAANVGGDPVEVLAVSNGTANPVTMHASFELVSGPTPNFVKYVFFEGGPIGSFNANEFDTQSPTAYGHANAAGAEAVGAAIFTQTEEFPQPDPLVTVPCVPACVNNFSSAGGIPVFFDLQGNRLAVAELRRKPEITGPDGGNTTFFFFDSIRDADASPNFFGTSASAPHVAAANALAISARSEGIAGGRAGERFRMCRVIRGNERSVTVGGRLVPFILDRGGRFRDCGALRPQGYLDALHDTAQDMSLRAFPAVGGGGTAVPVPNPVGFDFDTGYGFIDAVEFINVTNGL